MVNSIVRERSLGGRSETMG